MLAMDSSAASQKACDSCRRRKVKCDITESSTAICSNCQRHGIACLSSIPLKRRGPKPGNTRRTSRGPRTPTGAEARDDQEPAGDRSILPGPQEFAWETQPASWNTRSAIEANPAPQTSSSPSSQITSTIASSRLDVHGQLIQTLSRVLPAQSFESITTKCIDLYFQYLFPLIPIVDEASTRCGLTAVWQAYNQSTQSPTVTTWSVALQSGPSASNAHSRAHMHPELNSIFTLITALCAESASMIPTQLFPEGPLIAEAFLTASRNSLLEYLESDMENPNATSVAIRYFHSNCLHAAGKPRFSWHIFGEAARLAQMMRLYDESSYEGLDSIEAELRRRAFWILYIGDKSAAILNNRPITIHKFNFESGITASYPSEVDTHHPNSPQIASTETQSIMTGFNFNIRLWQAAADFLLELRLALSTVNPNKPNILTPEQRSKIDYLYIQFMTCLDSLPAFLQLDPGAYGHVEDTASPREYLIQRVNLRVSFHCLKMVITQKFESIELSSSRVGIEQSNTLALRKTEIARDMIRAIREAPFWALQVNGESCVEKIRLIGASLLEVIHTNKDSPLATRARSEFVVLLDVLTRLDSKASDALRDGSSWQG